MWNVYVAVLRYNILWKIKCSLIIHEQCLWKIFWVFLSFQWFPQFYIHSHFIFFSMILFPTGIKVCQNNVLLITEWISFVFTLKKDCKHNTLKGFSLRLATMNLHFMKLIFISSVADLTHQKGQNWLLFKMGQTWLWLLVGLMRKQLKCL